MKNLPKVIYLQIDDDCEKQEGFEKYFLEGEITWSPDKIGKNDIRYVLDKRHTPKPKP